MAYRVANHLNARAGFVVAHALDGSTPDLQRREVYARHQRGDFQFLCVCGLCREGYNDPGVGAIAVFRPTKSRSLAEQMKGRGSRPLRGLVDGLETAEERLCGHRGEYQAQLHDRRSGGHYGACRGKDLHRRVRGRGAG